MRPWNGGAKSPSWNWSRAEGLDCFEYVDAACVRDTMYTSLQLGLAGFTYGAQGSYYVRQRCLLDFVACRLCRCRRRPLSEGRHFCRGSRWLRSPAQRFITAQC